MESNEELFKREYLCEWIENTSYTEAYKLWLWYNYHCELYDSKICTGSNEYGDYMPASDLEHKLIRQNAFKNLQIIQNERIALEQKGEIISEWDWLQAKNHLCRHKLKALEEEYKYYFEEKID